MCSLQLQSPVCLPSHTSSPHSHGDLHICRCFFSHVSIGREDLCALKSRGWPASRNGKTPGEISFRVFFWGHRVLFSREFLFVATSRGGLVEQKWASDQANPGLAPGSTLFQLWELCDLKLHSSLPASPSLPPPSLASLFSSHFPLHSLCPLRLSFLPSSLLFSLSLSKHLLCAEHCF